MNEYLLFAFTVLALALGRWLHQLPARVRLARRRKNPWNATYRKEKTS